MTPEQETVHDYLPPAMSSFTSGRNSAELASMKFNCFSYSWVLAIAVVLTPAFLGCGQGNRPELGQVNGTVTLDGRPLANATVLFKPQTGRGSFGVTDQDGQYELFYIRDIKGAIVGTHTIRITTATENAAKEAIPSRYNLRSELQRDVERGDNTIDLELSSDSTKRG